MDLGIKSKSLTQISPRPALAYPIGTEFNRIRIPPFILAEIRLPCPAPDSITILDDLEIVDGGIIQNLLEEI